jgi:hypothetical protein
MRKTIIAAAGTAAAAAVIGSTGLAIASTHSATTQTEHFQFVSTSTTSRNSSLIAYGAFTAGGTDTAGNSTDTVTLPGGTFKVVHKDVSHTQHFNPATCQFTFGAKATYTIGSGTGKYAGISGSGTAQVSVLGIGARNSKGACSMSLPPVAQQQIIRASGPVSLP